MKQDELEIINKILSLLEELQDLKRRNSIYKKPDCLIAVEWDEVLNYD